MTLKKSLIIFLLAGALFSSHSSDFSRSYNSVNGGLSFIVGEDAEYYKPGFDLSAIFMYRPIKYLAFGFAPSYNRWALDLPSFFPDDFSASLHSFTPYVGVKPIVPISDNVLLHFLVASGPNILMANVRSSANSDTDSEVYWGMNYGVGVSIKKLNITWKTAFVRNNEVEESIPWMSLLVGFSW